MRTAISSGGKADASSVYDVAVLGKALDLLETVAAGPDLGLSQLSERTGVSKGSAFRVLSTLESRGYLSKDGQTRKYGPGPRLLALSHSVVARLDLVHSARSVLKRLHAEFDETVNLGVLSGGQIVYVDMLESHRGLRMAAQLGARDALHSTALGKAIVAALPVAEARQLFRSYRRARATPRTLVSLDDLEADLARVRQRGYAIDDEENEVGARCVGAAVVDTAGRPVAAISVSGPASRMDGDVLERIGAAVCDAAHDIESKLGY
jgi:IclR family transcriptional regulator, acetate operon repressor